MKPLLRKVCVQSGQITYPPQCKKCARLTPSCVRPPRKFRFSGQLCAHKKWKQSKHTMHLPGFINLSTYTARKAKQCTINFVLAIIGACAQCNLLLSLNEFNSCLEVFSK
ncbi:hypothetical protein C0J52_01341 [Blattella germanica]|nr:hypothetical protein C0J52_01341 [Blattella germanica]